MIVGRFAPSPTGPLHIGSLVAAIGSYALARQNGGRWLVRMEDLDAPRVVDGCSDDILRTLEALGFDWDGPVVRQSGRSHLYRAALDELVAGGSAYPCGCSRAEIARAASAPHDGEGETVYPGTCSSGLPPGRTPRAWRVRVPAGGIDFDDLIQGSCCFDLAAACGDFVVRRADGLFAYQLAVVVDDALQGVNQVVRGADLLSSTPRQIHLQNLLGYGQPVYGHLPLVIAPDGGKLSKRDTIVSSVLRIPDHRSAVRLLSSALSFLGQPLPDGAESASPRELLRWSADHFNRSLVPRGPGKLQIMPPAGDQEREPT